MIQNTLRLICFVIFLSLIESTWKLSNPRRYQGMQRSSQLQTGQTISRRVGVHVSRKFALEMVLNDGINEVATYPGIYGLFKAREVCPPQVCIEQLLVNVVKSFQLSDLTIQWTHPVLMSLSVGFLAYAGISKGIAIANPPQRLMKSASSVTPTLDSFEDTIRNDDSINATQATSDSSMQAKRVDKEALKDAKFWHPILMSMLLVLYVFGIQGGIGSQLLQDKPILESPHAVTALVSFGLLSLQAVISLGINSSPFVRKGHKIMGYITAASIAVHLLTGLAFSFSN